MPHIQTCDPDVVIEEQSPGRIIYLSTASGERWRIDGECNRCGACWEGAQNADPMEMDMDCPVRPEIKDDFPQCTLSGEYL